MILCSSRNSGIACISFLLALQADISWQLRRDRNVWICPDMLKASLQLSDQLLSFKTQCSEFLLKQHLNLTCTLTFKSLVTD